MDFGIGEILERFEKHFGKLATKILLAIIGLAVAGVCFGLIWDHLLVPFYDGWMWFLKEGVITIPNPVELLSGLVASGFTTICMYLWFQILERRLQPRYAVVREEMKRLRAEAKEIAELKINYENLITDEQRRLALGLMPPSSTPDKP
jgi:hypothetical protein